MGAASSKAAKTASSAATRKYPSSAATSRASNPAQKQWPTSTQPRPSVHPEPSASSSKDQVIELDARDPDFGSRLSQIGPVQPTPTWSPSSTFAPTQTETTTSPSSQAANARQQIFPSPSTNPALVVVAAREKYTRAFEHESENLGRPMFAGRTLIRAEEIRKILSMRDDMGKTGAEIEKQLRLQPGLVGRLGPAGWVGNP